MAKETKKEVAEKTTKKKTTKKEKVAVEKEVKAPAKKRTAKAKEEVKKEAPAKETVVKEAPVKEAPVKEAPVKEAVAKEAPAQENVAEKKFIHGPVLRKEWVHEGDKKVRIDIPKEKDENGKWKCDQYMVDKSLVADGKNGPHVRALADASKMRHDAIQVKRVGEDKFKPCSLDELNKASNKIKFVKPKAKEAEAEMSMA